MMEIVLLNLVRRELLRVTCSIVAVIPRLNSLVQSILVEQSGTWRYFVTWIR